MNYYVKKALRDPQFMLFFVLEEELLSTYGEPYSHTLTGMIYQDGVRHLTFYLAKGKVTEMVLSDSSFH